MNAAETIQAAIDNMQRLRLAGNSNPADTELLVTLHRTIDAQLAILEWGIQVHDLKHNQHPSPLERRALGLAVAILGDTE